MTSHSNRTRIRVMRSTLKIWLSYALLALLTIPWYWHWIPEATVLVCGVPAWVVSAIVGSALVSCYTAWLLSYCWPDELPGERDQ